MFVTQMNMILHIKWSYQ